MEYKDVSRIPADIHAALDEAMGPRVRSLIVLHVHGSKADTWRGYGVVDDWFVAVELRRLARRRVTGTTWTWRMADLVGVEQPHPADVVRGGRLVWRTAAGGCEEVTVPLAVAQALEPALVRPAGLALS